MLADWEQHGVAAIEKVRETRPADYLKVVASILPKELNVNTNALGEMSDDELVGILEAVKQQLIASTATSAGAGAGAAAQREQAPALPAVH